LDEATFGLQAAFQGGAGTRRRLSGSLERLEKKAVASAAGLRLGKQEGRMDFRDRHVVVTGGTGALGRAVVNALLAAGAHCHVPYRQEKEKENLPGRALSLIPAPSLADEAVVRKLYGGLPALWASIHIAGGFAFAPLTDTSGELLRRLIDDNLVSCFLCCREAVTAMRRGKAGGRIVNVAALQALEPRNGANISAATAAKAGVAALSAALGEELAGEGILVNAVAPSIMDTPTNRSAMPNANFDAWPKVEEVAATILFLASPENKVGRGGVVPVFGASSQSAAS
jgi:NAD(P)-dependent dehydrogenase (short-subunit alcohol dehydrogenase family)